MNFRDQLAAYAAYMVAGGRLPVAVVVAKPQPRPALLEDAIELPPPVDLDSIEF